MRLMAKVVRGYGLRAEPYGDYKEKHIGGGTVVAIGGDPS